MNLILQLALWLIWYMVILVLIFWFAERLIRDIDDIKSKLKKQHD